MNNNINEIMSDYKKTIGIEVHVELKTKEKLFSPSKNLYGTIANKNVNISIITTLFFISLITVIAVVAIPNNMPLNTSIKELILSLTISVSELASSLGCFKLIINPKIALNVGNTKLAKVIISISKILILKYTKKIVE